MQGTHKDRQNSEVKRNELLAKLALIRTEVEEAGAQVQLLGIIDKIEQDIKSARVNIRKYRDFLMEETKQIDSVKETLNSIKEIKRKNFIDQMKSSVFLHFILFIPFIIMNKLYYLSLISKHIPMSSALIYMSIGDILFYTWIISCIFYCIAYRYITINYIVPFRERYPPLNIPIRLCSASTFTCLYGQFMFHSASIIPRLISPSWGPSVANVLSLIIAFLNSSPIIALITVISLWPIVGGIMKKYKLFLNYLGFSSFLTSLRRSRNKGAEKERRPE